MGAEQGRVNEALVQAESLGPCCLESEGTQSDSEASARRPIFDQTKQVCRATRFCRCDSLPSRILAAVPRRRDRLVWTGSRNAALDASLAALKLRPNDFDALRLLSEMYAETNEYDRAV